MIEFRRQSISVPLEDFPDQKKVLLSAADEQDAQKGRPELCRG